MPVRLERTSDQGPNILGFFIMAKEAGVQLVEDNNSVLGVFSDVVNAEKTSCQNSSGITIDSSALTHRQNNPVTFVEATWTAPASLPKQPVF